MKDGWFLKTLSNCCYFENGDRGKNYPSRKSFVPEGMPFVNAGHLINNRIAYKEMNYISQENFDLLSRGKFQNGDLLFCLRGSLGKFAIVTDSTSGAIASSLVIVRPKKEVSNRYLAYYFESDLCRSFVKEFEGGTAQPNLGASDLKQFQIPIPPLPEQKRIVAILDRAFAAIDQAKANLKRNIQNAEELFQSKLNQVFYGNMNNGDWVTEKLGDIGKVSMCKRVFKDQTSNSGEIPFFKIGTFGKFPDAFISQELYSEYKKKYSFPKKGDVLLSASGTIGRRVRYDGKPAYFQDSNIVWIDNDERQVSNDYLYLFYEVCKWQTTKGATISRLYNNNLREIEISFPVSPLDQRRIVKALERLRPFTEQSRVNYESKLDHLEELKKSLLQKAFAGELT